MKRQIILAALLVCPSFAAWPQTPAPATLPNGANYPDPYCTKPQVALIKTDAHLHGAKTVVDSGDGSGDAVRSYNARVTAFNRDAAAYHSCMHDYIEGANRDVQTIQDKANADLKQITERANASLKAIQDKIRQAVADANDVSAAVNGDTARPK